MTKIREVRIAGYKLVMSDSGKTDYRGCTKIAYRLTRGKLVIFDGSDFCGSPLHADDSDETVKSLLGFLTLKPGDTDAEYFASYTPAQLDWCTTDAESLAMAVYDRFGFDD